MESVTTPVRKTWVGVDYLVASKTGDERPGESVRYVGATFETAGECVHWQHGYEGLDICGGYGQSLQRLHRDLRGDVLVRLPGRAMEWIRDRNILSESDYKTTDAEICRFFVENEFSATRIDVSIDTNDPEITPRNVRELVKAGHFTCRGKKAGVCDQWDLHNPQTEGDAQTFTMGSRSSSRYLRVYNKQAELLKSIGKDVGHLTRFELEIKGEAATRVMSLIAKSGVDLIPGIFSGWVSFKDPADDNPRIERRSDIAWWRRLVSDANPVILGLTRTVSDPEKSMRWLSHSVAKTLFLAGTHGGMAEIRKAMAMKSHKVTKKEKKKWKQFARVRMERKMAGEQVYGEVSPAKRTQRGNDCRRTNNAKGGAQ